MAIRSVNPRLKAGDRVWLVSGGSPMTAERVYVGLEYPFARCVWEDARGRIHREPFDLAALRLTPWTEAELSRGAPAEEEAR